MHEYHVQFLIQAEWFETEFKVMFLLNVSIGEINLVVNVLPR